VFNEILGLPLHPLIIHIPVILTPLLAVLAAVYALVPRTRGVLTWAVAGLAPVVPVSVFAAKLSGEALLESRFSTVDGVLGQRIAEHHSFANPLLFTTLALGLVSLGLVYVSRGDRFSRPVRLAVSGLTVVLAVVALYYVVRAGHSGATAAWKND
jgi:uncharacterized membrane protein